MQSVHTYSLYLELVPSSTNAPILCWVSRKSVIDSYIIHQWTSLWDTWVQHTPKNPAILRPLLLLPFPVHLWLSSNFLSQVFLTKFSTYSPPSPFWSRVCLNITPTNWTIQLCSAQDRKYKYPLHVISPISILFYLLLLLLLSSSSSPLHLPQEIKQIVINLSQVRRCCDRSWTWPPSSCKIEPWQTLNQITHYAVLRYLYSCLKMTCYFHTLQNKQYCSFVYSKW
jgi:hypothetical protein